MAVDFLFALNGFFLSMSESTEHDKIRSGKIPLYDHKKEVQVDIVGC